MIESHEELKKTGETTSDICLESGPYSKIRRLLESNRLEFRDIEEKRETDNTKSRYKRFYAFFSGLTGEIYEEKNRNINEKYLTRIHEMTHYMQSFYNLTSEQKRKLRKTWEENYKRDLIEEFKDSYDVLREAKEILPLKERMLKSAEDEYAGMIDSLEDAGQKSIIEKINFLAEIDYTNEEIAEHIGLDPEELYRRYGDYINAFEEINERKNGVSIVNDTIKTARHKKVSSWLELKHKLGIDRPDMDKYLERHEKMIQKGLIFSEGELRKIIYDPILYVSDTNIIDEPFAYYAEFKSAQNINYSYTQENILESLDTYTYSDRRKEIFREIMALDNMLVNEGFTNNQAADIVLSFEKNSLGRLGINGESDVVKTFWDRTEFINRLKDAEKAEIPLHSVAKEWIRDYNLKDGTFYHEMFNDKDIAS